MSLQKDAFKKDEGNNWYQRNKVLLNTERKEIVKIDTIIRDIELYPKKVLEIGCSNGCVLNSIYKAT